MPVKFTTAEQVEICGRINDAIAKGYQVMVDREHVIAAFPYSTGAFNNGGEIGLVKFIREYEWNIYSMKEVPFFWMDKGQTVRVYEQLAGDAGILHEPVYPSPESKRRSTSASLPPS